MKWQIPAKTFLLGEYCAVAGGAAIIVTTSPCFEIALEAKNTEQSIHPDSPAGLYWAGAGFQQQGLSWYDPYDARGGLGASTAQFLGAYIARCTLVGKKPKIEDLLAAYYQCAWNGLGLRPSGYDLIAQAYHQCVYIHKERVKTYDWCFEDIGFLLTHSGTKIATHQHLQTASLPENIDQLSAIVDFGQLAFETSDSSRLIAAVNAYQNELQKAKLTKSESLAKLTDLKTTPNVLAAKGCGALGADVFLLIFPKNELSLQAKNLSMKGWTILGSSNTLYRSKPLLF